MVVSGRLRREALVAVVALETLDAVVVLGDVAPDGARRPKCFTYKQLGVNA